MWVAYFGFGVALLLFVGFFVALLVAGIIDRKNQIWLELQRTNYERRRPAAK